MLLSELICNLNAELATHGDMKVFSGDMDSPIVETVESFDSEEYGAKYLFIDTTI